MKFDSLSVRTRLNMGFGLMLTLMLVLAGNGHYNSTRVNDSLTDIAGDKVTKIVASADWRVALLQSVNHLKDLVEAKSPADATQVMAQLDAVQQKRGAVIAQLRKSLVKPRGIAALKVIDEARTRFETVETQILALAKGGDMDGARAAYAGLHPAQVSYLTAVEQLSDINRDVINTSRAEAAEVHGLGRNTTLALIAAALLLGVAVAWRLSRSLLRQLGGEPAAAADVARAVAEGDLATSVAIAPTDTTSLLAQLRRMQGSLTQVVANVRSNAEGVATASAEIASGNQDLSTRTEQQASTLQQTAAAMTELDGTVRRNAENAAQADQLAKSASAVASRGGEVVGQVVETMKGINDSSKRIADIISVIDGIAFQTNILALNAAVEAARAGEQGRGFAVVASEVRSLAQRSSDAAREIKTLINASVERVEHGTTLVDRAGATMGELVVSIKRVTDIVGEISSASAEQREGVAQVGQAVAKMDQTTQQNAALVEESAAAAESLKAQAQQLVQAVAVFKLAGGAASKPAAATLLQAAPHTPVAAVTPVQTVTRVAAATPVERRGPNRATNVVRPAFKANTAKPAQAAAPASRPAAPAAGRDAIGGAAAKTGTDDWESF